MGGVGRQQHGAADAACGGEARIHEALGEDEAAAAAGAGGLHELALEQLTARVEEEGSEGALGAAEHEAVDGLHPRLAYHSHFDLS